MPALTAARLERLARDLRGALEVEEVGPDRLRTRSGRRAQGAYFTPQPLVEFVVAETIGRRFALEEPRWRRDGAPHLLILDPAAGDGRFLEAAAAYLVRCAAKRGYDRDRARRAILRRCVVGLERDPQFAAAARRRLGDGAAIYRCEALLSSPADLGLADAVIGNPPYLRSIHLGRADESLRSALRGRYAATSHGEWDLYAAFLEQALEWTAPGGEIGLVVPSRWLTAAFAARLREKLASAAAVRAVVDFGAQQIFRGVTTYASVAFLSRSRSRTVEVARFGGRRWRCGQVDASELGAAPWRLSVGRGRALVERLANSGPQLGAVARIVKGAGTNADPVYVFDRRRVGAAVESDEEPKVEPALLRRCLRGRDVEAFGEASARVLCLVPYDRAGRLFSPAVMRRRYLRAFAYLNAHRERLEARESGRFSGERFYCFGRPQNLAFHSDLAPKVVIPDVAREGRALLDWRAAMVLDSAYAVRPLPGDWCSTALLVAVLSSRIVRLWLRETGVPLRGGYLRLKTAYLVSLPLPAPSAATAAIEARVARDAKPGDREEMDELVRLAYGVSRAAWHTE